MQIDISGVCAKVNKPVLRFVFDELFKTWISAFPTIKQRAGSEFIYIEILLESNQVNFEIEINGLVLFSKQQNKNSIDIIV